VIQHRAKPGQRSEMMQASHFIAATSYIKMKITIAYPMPSPLTIIPPLFLSSGSGW